MFLGSSFYEVVARSLGKIFCSITSVKVTLLTGSGVDFGGTRTGVRIFDRAR